MTTYTALTIGPIYRSLAEARKTRQLWGISYLFSHVMREIRQSLIDNHGLQPADILMPARDSIQSSSNGTGMYPDRLIYRNPAGAKDPSKTIATAIQGALSTLATKIGIEGIEDKLKQSLQLYHCQVKIEENDNIILTINAYLDTLELQQRALYPWKEGDDLCTLSDTLNGKVFLREAFEGMEGDNFRFQSIPEISTIDLGGPKDSPRARKLKALAQEYMPKPDGKLEEREDDFFKALKEDPDFRPRLKRYHKYFCIVHADGDNIGKALTAIGHDMAKTQALSQALFAFSAAAVQAIRHYQGTPVYAGGDDLLFFAPVIVDQGNQRSSIFDLLSAIDLAFDTHVLSKEGLDVGGATPSISYGLSISYYKYPLQEALVASREALFDTAKSHPGKNAIAFRLLKHSGTAIKATFGKGRPSKDPDAHSPLAALLQRSAGQGEFLSSVQYTLDTLRPLLSNVLTDTQQATERLGHFFESNFDEFPHEVHRAFLQEVKQLLLSTYQDLAQTPSPQDDHSQAAQDAITQVHAALRFVQFIHQNT